MIALTPRERQVGGLLLLGLTVKETAYELWISPKTVKKHRQAFCHKSGIDVTRSIKAAMARRLFEQDRLAGCGPVANLRHSQQKVSESPTRRLGYRILKFLEVL
jgi:DNA-binding CsgD family transcriptional regulator